MTASAPDFEQLVARLRKSKASRLEITDIDLQRQHTQARQTY